MSRGNPTPKKGGRRPILKLAAVAASIVRFKGNIADVARHHRVARSSVLQFVAKNPDLDQVLKDARDGMKDAVESRFYKDCLKDDPKYQTSRIFFLKTQCKDRGYIERQQVELGELGPTEVQEEVIATRQVAADPNPTDPGASPVP